MTEGRTRRSIACGLAIAALAVPLAACGSSKPGYCKDKDTLKADIQNLPSEVRSGGVSAVKSNLQKIETDAKNLVASAKSDFPSETQAISSSINGLKASIQSLGSAPTAQKLIALVPQAQGVASSVQAFDKATSSKCK